MSGALCPWCHLEQPTGDDWKTAPIATDSTCPNLHPVNPKPAGEECWNCYIARLTGPLPWPDEPDPDLPPQPMPSWFHYDVAFLAVTKDGADALIRDATKDLMGITIAG